MDISALRKQKTRYFWVDPIINLLSLLVYCRYWFIVRTSPYFVVRNGQPVDGEMEWSKTYRFRFVHL